MVARVYSWADAGAPVIAGSSHTALNLIQTILDACLVNGYGSKAAAGWTKVGSRVAYQNAANDCTALFIQSTTDYLVMCIMDSWTNAAGVLLGGVNPRSGSYALTAENGTANHRLFVPYTVNSGSRANCRWCLVADENTFVLTLGSFNSNTSAYYLPISLYVGRYINYAGLTGKATSVALGGFASVSNTSTQYQFAGGGTVLRHPETGLSSYPPVWATPWHEPSTFKNYNSAYADADIDTADPARLTLYQPRLRYSTTTGAIVGAMRGVAVDPYLQERSMIQLMRALGQSYTTNAYLNWGRSVVGPDGYTYAPCGVFHKQFLLTDNPDFW